MKKLFFIVFVLGGTLIFVLGLYMPITNHKGTVSYDFSKTENFHSNYLGLSFVYPDSLSGKGINNGVFMNDNEEVAFLKKIPLVLTS